MKIQTEVDELGFFGEYGGQYVPETLMPAIIELKKAYEDAKSDTHFKKEFNYYLSEYVGRETPLTFAESYTKLLGGAKIYLKREDLNHTGAHKINNAIGQALLAKRMGKTKLVAETGAGQHGVASATIAALFDMDLIVFMGSEDIKRQQLNVFRMELLGAKVVSVSDGQGTLSDAVNKALQYWVNHVEDTHYLLGSALGPDPFPTMVRDFQSVIGNEIKSQILSKEGRLPDALVACVGGGSNSIGTFYPFIQDDVKLYGVEAAGKGSHTHNHALAIGKGKPGVLHGSKMYLIQNDDGQIELAHSISAGLDYPGIGPEHSYYNDIGRVSYVSATDNEAMEALITFSKVEGIIPAIESAHALSYVEKLAPNMDENPYIMGDLNFIHHLKTLTENGADIVEIGVPFSDPVADGPIIMKEGRNAIDEGSNIKFIFDELIKNKNTISSKYVLMTYYNILSAYGEELFLDKCDEAGVYGLIIPDLPYELTKKFKKDFYHHSVKIISLIAMTASDARIMQIAKNSEGFIYTVTMNATTGNSGEFHPDLKRKIEYIKKVSKIPVVAGFGIKNIASVADGIVIGSEIVKRIEIDSRKEFITYIKSIRTTLNSL
ncbi:MAG: tryptophan synthase subunit beta [Staphylococcus epidermidis]|nr:tryptophan synthase subunit beta [Staphylococcus epidermidis]